MLIYEKYVDENGTKVRHLYGTMANEPNEYDNQLVFKDSEGQIITNLTFEDKYVDDTHGGIMVIKNNEEIPFSVYIKDSKGTLVEIIPNNTHDLAIVCYAIVDYSQI